MSVVVLSGSLGSTSTMWEPQTEALRNFEVVRVEHPGHGDESMTDFRNVRDLARRVREVVQTDRFSFVGLSLGGAIGMQLALDAPERLDRLVLAATSARLGSAEAWDERIELLRKRGMEAIADVVLPRWFTPNFGDVQRFRSMLVATPPDVYVRYCEVLRDFDLRGRLGGIAAPTLTIAGAEDPTSPPEHLEAVAAEIPGARVVIVSRAAHMVNVEGADEFNGALRGHLA